MQVFVLEQAVAGIGLYNRKWPGPKDVAARSALQPAVSLYCHSLLSVHTQCGWVPFNSW